MHSTRPPIPSPQGGVKIDHQRASFFHILWWFFPKNSFLPLKIKYFSLFMSVGKNPKNGAPWKFLNSWETNVERMGGGDDFYENTHPYKSIRNKVTLSIKVGWVEMVTSWISLPATWTSVLMSPCSSSMCSCLSSTSSGFRGYMPGSTSRLDISYIRETLHGILIDYPFKYTEAEFKEFIPRRWIAQTRFQLSTGSNLKTLKFQVEPTMFKSGLCIR